MAKRTYNRRGRQTARTPVRNDGRGRQQRQKAAQVARDTGSKDRVTRGRGVTRTRTGAPRGAQGPATPPQQGPSRRVTGMIGSRTTPATKTTTGPRTPGPGKAGNIGRQLRTAAKVGTIVNPRTDLPAKLGATASLIADLATRTKGKPAKTAKPARRGMSSMGKDYKAKEKEASRKAVARNFDRAFAAARKAGKKTFTWRGKTYTTKMKGE